jgi:hypothetical protein
MEKAEKEVATVHIIELTPTQYTISKKSRVNNMKEVSSCSVCFFTEGETEWGGRWIVLG